MSDHNPNCPGVPHRPDDPLYRAAVERHYKEHRGAIEFKHRDDIQWSERWESIFPNSTYFNWGGYEYRPAEPLRTDARPDGLHGPGNEWRWVLKGEAVEPGDKECAPISGEWFTLESPSINDGSRIVRRRLNPEQARSYEETVEEMRAAGGDGWDDVTDVDAELRKMRGQVESDKCDRIARMEQLVKRLAAMGDPLSVADLYQILDIIQEAKELIDGKDRD